MKKITIYKVDTGEIQRVVTCPDDSIEFQLQSGEAVVEGDSNDVTQKVVDGIIVDKDEPSDEEKNVIAVKELRRRRNSLLKSTDWTQLVDSPLSDSDKTTWATYRQALRDLPENNANITDISNVEFPDMPN
jgi:hypothetical protein